MRRFGEERPTARRRGGCCKPTRVIFTVGKHPGPRVVAEPSTPPAPGCKMNLAAHPKSGVEEQVAGKRRWIKSLDAGYSGLHTESETGRALQ